MDTHKIADFVEPAFLRAQLANTFAQVRRKHVLVGFRFGGESSHALISDHADMETALAMPTGCLTKLFTATLARQAVTAGWFNLDDRIPELLPRTAHPNVFSEVTIRQLLEHTHGLDDSMIDRVPLRSDGFIDSDALQSQVSVAPRLTEPGELYSYANVGAWLIAAVLERCSGQPYETLLRERLFAPLDIPLDRGSSHGVICPSVGGTLVISVAHLLEFLHCHGLKCPEQWPSEGQRGAFGEIVRLPGWNALERGVYLGWKYHGAGWFGHNSTWPGASALARVQPQRGIAIVIASRDHAASVVATKLFGRLLPELVDLRIPQFVTSEETRDLDLRRYVGVYRSAARSVLIRSGGDGLELSARHFGKSGAGNARSVDATLQTAGDNVFFTRPVDTKSFPYVQFIAPHAHTFTYLWNGRFVLRRAECPAVRTPEA